MISNILNSNTIDSNHIFSYLRKLDFKILPFKKIEREYSYFKYIVCGQKLLVLLKFVEEILSNQDLPIIFKNCLNFKVKNRYMFFYLDNSFNINKIEIYKDKIIIYKENYTIMINDQKKINNIEKELQYIKTGFYLFYYIVYLLFVNINIECLLLIKNSLLKQNKNIENSFKDILDAKLQQQECLSIKFIDNISDNQITYNYKTSIYLNLLIIEINSIDLSNFFKKHKKIAVDNMIPFIKSIEIYLNLKNFLINIYLMHEYGEYQIKYNTKERNIYFYESSETMEDIKISDKDYKDSSIIQEFLNIIEPYINVLKNNPKTTSILNEQAISFDNFFLFAEQYYLENIKNDEIKISLENKYENE